MWPRHPVVPVGTARHPWSIWEDPKAPLSELIPFFRVALSESRVVEVEAAFAVPCPTPDDIAAS